MLVICFCFSYSSIAISNFSISGWVKQCLLNNRSHICILFLVLHHLIYKRELAMENIGSWTFNIEKILTKERIWILFCLEKESHKSSIILKLKIRLQARMMLILTDNDIVGENLVTLFYVFIELSLSIAIAIKTS